MPPDEYDDAHLFLAKRPTPLAQPLQIRGETIRFITPPLQRSCDFTCTEDRRHWRLLFFRTAESTVAIDVFFSEKCPRKRHWLGSARWIDNQNDNANNKQHSLTLSEFLRGSRTKDLDDAIETAANRALVPDRSSIGYFCFDLDQFERVLVCFALAVAYQQAMFACTERLADESLAENGAQLADLYKATLRFNASAYFSYPIKRDNHELFEVWRALSRHWHLDDTNTELTQQLSEVATLIQNEEKAQAKTQRDAEQQRQGRRDRAFQKRTTWLVLWLTALSLISLSQITPDVIATFFHQWRLFFTNLPEHIGSTS